VKKMQKKNPASMGKGINLGHGGNTPGIPDPVEYPLPPQMQAWIWQGQLEPETKLYKMGTCKIMCSPPRTESHGWHLSISHEDRYPSWDEIAKARYSLLPHDSVFVMVLPQPNQYTNIHNYCFQLYEDGKRRE
jgi:hypothetical protein